MGYLGKGIDEGVEVVRGLRLGCLPQTHPRLHLHSPILILLPSSLFPFALSIPESYIFSRRRDQGAVVSPSRSTPSLSRRLDQGPVVSPSRSRPPLSRRQIKAAVDLTCRCLVVQIEARSRPPSSSPAAVSPSRARRD
ncbi:hypothetical protein SO802_005054 [Lithocarpus litseifolius]|uniref:Uncharacterized protein n=1 Tax=Lithocarpus litseifolius TaxID=425828 RepID=A0AAW2DLM5_9ROSI